MAQYVVHMCRCASTFDKKKSLSYVVFFWCFFLGGGGGLKFANRGIIVRKTIYPLGVF